MENTKAKKDFKQWFKDLNKKKILSIALNVLIWIFVAFSVLITVLVFSAQGSSDGVPSVFGKSLITISTDSMEPTYKAGDLVFMEKLDNSEKENLEVGDIITFHAPIDIDGDGMVGDINTHRIDAIDGVSYVTKGDNNLIADNEGDDKYTVHPSDVIGICTEKGKIGGLGNVISFLRTSLGFFLCIVLPLILFFLYELYNFVSIIVTERAKRAAAAASAPAIDEEEIKRRAVEEYLAKEAARKKAESAGDGAENNAESGSDAN